RRVAAGDHHLLDRADFARVEPALERAEARVEAAIEAAEHRHPGPAHLGEAGVDFLQAEVDRLLAEDRLAGLRRGNGEARVRIGRRGDEHRADFRIGEGLFLAHDFRAVARGELLRRFGVDVDDVAQPHVLERGDIRGMDLADAAGTELGDFDHFLVIIDRSRGGVWQRFASRWPRRWSASWPHSTWTATFPSLPGYGRSSATATSPGSGRRCTPRAASCRRCAPTTSRPWRTRRSPSPRRMRAAA